MLSNQYIIFIVVIQLIQSHQLLCREQSSEVGFFLITFVIRFFQVLFIMFMITLLQANLSIEFIPIIKHFKISLGEAQRTGAEGQVSSR